MAFIAKSFDIGAGDSIPRDVDLAARLLRQQVGGRSLLLLHPNSQDESRLIRYAVGILRLRVGCDATDGSGQIVLTARRILGLINVAGGKPDIYSEASGKVVCFSVNRADVARAEIPTKWRGSPKRVLLEGSDQDRYGLDIQVVVATIGKDGKAAPSNLKSFVTRFLDAERTLLG